MTNVLLRKAGLAFDKSKTGLALLQATFALVVLMEAKTSLCKTQRKKAAAGLESGAKREAVMDIEQLIRQEFELSAYESLRQQCNVLADHLKMVSSQKDCPSEVRQAVCTIIWAADKAEVPEELLVVKAQLVKKYGKEFAAKARSNENSCVNKMVAEKLLFQGCYPATSLVDDHIEAMSKELNLPTSPKPPVTSSSKPAATKTSTSDPETARDPAPASTTATKETLKKAPNKTPKQARKDTPKELPLEATTVTPTTPLGASTGTAEPSPSTGGKAASASMRNPSPLSRLSPASVMKPVGAEMAAP